ncbi:TaqI-like C-terminal specificity domain-containing protein [Streptococcus uberis]|uniref:TaqI-like C-terminal specificity domain-containing protein n=1 Tax=Streptococcus uberis TaxID=1349 RepID=UPI003D77A5C6
MLRGRDILRYKVDFQNLYLINTHNGYISEKGEIVHPIDIQDFPYIKDWLDNGAWNTKSRFETNIQRLTKRTDQGITPYNLRSIAYNNSLNKPKILYSEIVRQPQFYFDSEALFIPEASAFLISGNNLETLIVYLNSKVVAWIFKVFYAGGGLGEGFRYKKKFIENLPIPKNKIIATNNEKIELLIMEAYKLNQNEINYIRSLI